MSYTAASISVFVINSKVLKEFSFGVNLTHGVAKNQTNWEALNYRKIMYSGIDSLLCLCLCLKCCLLYPF